MTGKPRRQGGSVAVVHLEAFVGQITGEATHGGDDQVGPLTMPRLRRHLGRRLHHHHPRRTGRCVTQSPK